DVAGDVVVDGGDVATLKSFILHFPRPVIPTPPGLTGIVSPNAADPTLSLVSGEGFVVSGEEPALDRLQTTTNGALLTTNHSPLTISVMLDHPRPDGSTGLTEAILALKYDPSAFS